ncbi:MAG: HD domain-containing protein [Planctomycetales bacterium]|nr:HD domain-containing protein [Planctomycetales bacterium]
MSNTSLQLEKQTQWREGHCMVCNIPHPLRSVEPGETPERFACVGCDTVYQGKIRPNCPPELLLNVRACDGPHVGVPLATAAADPAPALFTGPSPPPHGIATSRLPAHEPVSCDMKNNASRLLDLQLERGRGLDCLRQGPSVNNRVKRHGAVPYAAENIEAVQRHGDASWLHVDALFKTLAAETPMKLDGLEKIAAGGLANVLRDSDLLTAFSINPTNNEYPSRHSVHVAMLAMSIGTTLGLDEKQLSELAIGCLIHDLGMLAVRSDVYRENRTLPRSDIFEIARHPLYTFDLIEQNLNWVPAGARMVAYQMHERCDGSGYPRARAGRQIHELARIAAVADVYVALVSPRPHRPAMMPYHAMEAILRDVKAGLFDADVVRGLLQTVSLFPLGSFVALSDQRVGRVLRANREQYMSPVVEVWNQNQLAAAPTILDLAQHDDVKVARALDRLG